MSDVLLDSMNSKRFGILRGDDISIICLIYDNSLTPSNSLSQAKPILFRTDSNFCIDYVFSNIDEFEAINFSDNFLEQCHFICETISSGGDYEFSYNCKYNIEEEMLKFIHHTISERTYTDNIINLIRYCDVKYISDNLGPDNNSFEGSVSKQTYIPEQKYIFEWGLYNYTRQNITSVWIRYKDIFGNISEIPLVYNTNSSYVLVSTNVDYGDDLSYIQGYDSSDNTIGCINLDAVNNISDKTEQFINNLENSEKINTET